MRNSVLLALLLLHYLFTWGQSNQYTHYTINDGLPSNTVYRIFSDKKGFIWFATDKGIARYNGFTFDNFTTADGLPDNEIFYFVEAPDGKIWLTTYNGKLCFYQNGKFYSEQNTPWMKIPSTLSHTRYLEVQYDSSVVVNYAWNNAFLYINHDSAATISLVKAHKEAGSRLSLQIRKVNPKVFEITYPFTRVQIDSKGEIIQVKRLPFTKPLSNVNSAQEKLFISGNTILDSSLAPVFTLPSPIQNEFLFFGIYNKIAFWGRNSGLYNSLDSSILLPGQQVISFTEDFQNNFWVSTHGNGVYKFPVNFKKSVKYLDLYEGGISHATIQDSKLTFITSKGVIYQGDVGKNLQKVYAGLEHLIPYAPTTHCLLGDSAAVIYLGDKLARVDHIQSQPSVSFQRCPVVPPFEGAKGFLYYDNHIYQVGLFNIIQYPDFHNKPAGTKPFFLTANDKSNRRIYACCIGPDGNVWYSFSNALQKSDPATGKTEGIDSGITFRKIAFAKNRFVGVSDLGKLYIGMKNGKGLKLETIWERDFILENLYKIDENRILISTNKNYSLLQFLPNGKHQLTIIENDLLPQQAEYVCANDSISVFFKGGDVTILDTRWLVESPSAPAVRFTSLLTQNRPLEISDTVSLAYGNSESIRLTFTPISFVSKYIYYQYSITEDGTEQWQDIAGTELNLLLPSFGEYTIKVRARSLASPYSEPATILLHIRKPYWATIPFWIAVTILLSLVIWLIIKWRTRQAIRKQKQAFETEKKFQQSEYKALNALMNPHFIFNSLNNIQGLINEDEKMTANEYLVVFSDMIRQNMHNIAKGNISLQKEINLCRNYLELEKLRFKEMINYQIVIGDDVDTEDIFIPPLLIQPLVENAIKHGLLPMQSDKAMVLLRIFEQGKELVVEVEDNGIGLTAASATKDKLHTSTGLNNLQQRIEYVRKIHDYEMTFSIEEIVRDMAVTGTIATIRLTLV